MKKHINIILLALSLLGLMAACAKPEQEVVVKQTLKVVTTDVIFGVDGGTGSILVEADDAVTATSERAWCQVSVDGKKIVVSVPEHNLSRMSRYSRITVKAGSAEVHVTAQQFGEVFSGLALEDAVIPKEGTTFTLAYTANMDVLMSSDQDWVHFEMVEDEELGKLVKVIVDENAGWGFRFATVSYSAGSNSGSARFTQEPTYSTSPGWKVEDTDGRFVFPDQIDNIAVTPPTELAEFPYFWDVVDPNEFAGVTDVAAKIRTQAMALMDDANAGKVTFTKGSASKEFANLPSTAKAVIILFDAQNYPTGQYALLDVAIPDRGPVKQLVEGWDIEHINSSYVHPDQLDKFTVTAKPGYEDVKYIATVVKKDAVSNVEDFAFTTFAMETRQEILDKVTAGELASFEDGLLSGTSTITAKNMNGDVYVVIVAFGDNQFYTGDYSYDEFGIIDAKRNFWIGTWTLTNTAGDSYTCTIKEKDDDSGYLSMSCNGLYTGTGSLLKSMNWVDLRYNADGTLTVFAQTHEELSAYYNATYGDIYPGLYGFYTNAEGKSYYRTAVPYDMFDLTFGEAGTAVITNIRLAPSSTGDFPYDSFAIRYWSSVKAARFSFTSNKTIKLDGLKLTKQ